MATEYRLTGELRILKRTSEASINRIKVLREIGDLRNIDSVEVLQQKWTYRGDKGFGIEWRDVPIIEEK